MNEKPNGYGFKELIDEIIAAKNQKQLDRVCGAIDYAYQHEKITAADNERLYGLINKCYAYLREE
ncbi:MAG: hypothetical protein IKD52_10100 [Exiguobacterium sp.]|nr:hypothetical protein [Exiguobacterium sp.]